MAAVDPDIVPDQVIATYNLILFMRPFSVFTKSSLQLELEMPVIRVRAARYSTGKFCSSALTVRLRGG
jgi:hypothetical protein